MYCFKTLHFFFPNLAILFYFSGWFVIVYNINIISSIYHSYSLVSKMADFNFILLIYLFTLHSSWCSSSLPFCQSLLPKVLSSQSTPLSFYEIVGIPWISSKHGISTWHETKHLPIYLWFARLPSMKSRYQETIKNNTQR